jgi:hypothetical protein
MRGQLFPDYIECAFLTGYRCEGCGRSGDTLEVSFPHLVWLREDQSMLISYPVRCPCGRAGLASSRIPFLLFCFLCGWLEYQGTARHEPAKSPQQIRPNGSPFLLNIFNEFEQVMASYGVRPDIEATIEPWAADTPVHHSGSPKDEPTESDRALFGASRKAWGEFLRRMGLSEKEGGHK